MPTELKNYKFGLGWDTECDVDASIVLLDKNGKLIEIIYYGHLKYKGAVIHSGDNLTGEGDGDDEVITIHKENLPKEVESIWTVITIYTSGLTSLNIKGAFCRIYDETTNAEFVKYNLSENLDGCSNGCIVASLHKHGDSWALKAREYYTQ